MDNSISLIALLSFATLVPYLVASGTCYLKFSIVFITVRNALGLQQVPSNMSLNGIALILAAFVMMPIAKDVYSSYQQTNVRLDNADAIVQFLDQGLDSYRDYLQRFSDPDLVRFFDRLDNGRAPRDGQSAQEDNERPSIFALLPAYGLTELKSAFVIGFYIYLPFVVVDLVVSSILLSLGMMMMSPVTISTPIKLILFVAMDGWSMLAKGMIGQYISLPR